MDIDFWHQRWQRGEIGWHLPHVNPLLQQGWPQLDIAPGSRVLVPLCGKSRDMVWLAAQGYRVLGVELSEPGVRAFFDEQAETPEVEDAGAYRRFRSGAIEILCGDFFALAADELTTIGAIYDRGALVALPPDLREHYVAHLKTVLPEPVPTLLITLDYAQHEMNGPPFAITRSDVSRYFDATHTIELLASADALADSPRFRERGVTSMTENAFALTPWSAC